MSNWTFLVVCNAFFDIFPIWCTFWQIPGRMGLLITTSLIAWNVYGSTKAPPSRGFSYIEVWITGVQTNITGAIFEYLLILALKRSNLNMSTKSSDMDQIIKLIDLGALTISLIFFSVFNIIYWFCSHCIIETNFYWNFKVLKFQLFLSFWVLTM